MPLNISGSIDRLCYRYPSMLVDAVTEHEPGKRLVAVKNVTVGEDFFQGHFPGTPLMPGVLMIETLAQVATLLLVQGPDGKPSGHAYLRGVDDAKFRRQVVPGDRLRLEVTLGPRRRTLARAHAVASIGEAVVAEAELVMAIVPAEVSGELTGVTVDPTAMVHPGARIGPGSVVGPHAIIGEHVRLGRDCQVGASSIVDGWTEIGDGNTIFPFASIGLIPQDLKFRGEKTTLTIGHRNVFREFVTIHRGTAGGGGTTDIGDNNVFMAYAHVAHDCHIGNSTIFGNAATLGGHVTVEDFATVSAFSGRAPVLPRRTARLHRRLFRRHQGRAAVCQDRRQPSTYLRHQHDRARASQVFEGLDQPAPQGVPLSAALQYQPGAGANRP